MTKKVKLAVFDRDLKARQYKKFPVTDDGSKIRVRTGGKRNFNPTFDNDSFIEFPRRSLVPPFKIVWDRVYFARNSAKACVRFRKVPNNLSAKLKSVADLQEIFQAAENGNPEATYQLNEIVNVISTATNADFLNPDPEQVTKAAESAILQSIGREKTETPMVSYIILAISIIILLKVLGVLV